MTFMGHWAGFRDLPFPTCPKRDLQGHQPNGFERPFLFIELKNFSSKINRILYNAVKSSKIKKSIAEGDDEIGNKRWLCRENKKNSFPGHFLEAMLPLW